MSISHKIKAVNNKIEQNKTQYNLDWQSAKISALTSRNVSKYEFLTSKDILPENDFLEKAAALKRFEYSPLGGALKAENSAAEEQHQKSDKVFNLIERNREVKKSRAKWTIVYNYCSL